MSGGLVYWGGQKVAMDEGVNSGGQLAEGRLVLQQYVLVPAPVKQV